MRATTLSYYKELVLVTAVVYNLKCDKLVRITPFILFSKKHQKQVMVRDMLIKSISHICENCNLSLTKSVTYHNNEINSKYNIFLPKL